ncbi:histidinol-phosphate aminotransferase [Desulfurispirillum indicum S5]|uniref:Histidinol-phosphate aminotransferase n=1 Tax=Desulfurispirillum indicum (strain ATCC BAA-1389 / DSM 22839 / S5) TaxID=653733 RepID=E6W1T4_DESIS|nr:histidinol-phosphate transaminase [Desulfurispirillum indicum]ADU65466.1 histidinol-phosphate aminotransferase [Desulfurispirillum indicum S5]
MLVSQNVEELTPYQPGKPVKEVERELGIRDTIKLASNENPLGASPKATAAVLAMAHEANRYPEGGCYYLRKKLAALLQLQEENLVFGNGSNEIIELVIRTFVLPGEEILFFDPSFAVYPIIAKAADRDFRAVPLRQDSFEMNVDDMLAAIGPRTKALFITTPNNPVGNYIPHGELVRLISATPANVLVCVDEAYVEYATEGDCRTVIDLVLQYENLLIMRTFSKAYGLSGYRIGYGVGSPKIINYLNKTRQPFNVNLLAQTAAEAALDDREFLDASVGNNSREMQRIVDCISLLGLTHVPSQANFILIDTLGPGRPVFEGLLREGVIVRHIPHPMIANFVRVTVGTPAENSIFLEKFAKVLRQEGRLAN